MILPPNRCLSVNMGLVLSLSGRRLQMTATLLSQSAPILMMTQMLLMTMFKDDNDKIQAH